MHRTLSELLQDAQAGHWSIGRVRSALKVRRGAAGSGVKDCGVQYLIGQTGMADSLSSKHDDQMEAVGMNVDNERNGMGSATAYHSCYHN